MRMLTMAVVVLLGAARALLGCCSCTAPNGSCTASANCGDGAGYAVCSNSSCTAGCIENQAESLRPAQARPGEAAGPTVTYSAVDISAAELQAVVSDALGVRFLFVPKKANDQFSVELREVPAADLMKGLAKLGAVAVIEEQEGDAQDKPGAVRFSLKAENVDAATVASLLRQLFGEAVAVDAAQPGSLVSLELKDVTLGALRNTLSKITGIRVFVRPEN